jgi:hypothetical protein
MHLPKSDHYVPLEERRFTDVLQRLGTIIVYYVGPYSRNSAGLSCGLTTAPHLSQYLLQRRLVGGNKRGGRRDSRQQPQQLFCLSLRCR